MTFDINANGLKKTDEDLKRIHRDLHTSPMESAMRQAVLVVERDAKKNAPVDTGRLRASITGEVRSEGLFSSTVKGIVGSNVKYAPYVELGTKPHFPPLDALQTWAARRGMSAYQVARAIAARGTKAVRYLQRAVESNEKKIMDILGDGVEKIIRKP